MRDMRYGGILSQWNDDRGFGWIEADGGGERLFVHISAFEPRPSAEHRPRPGLRLEFAVGMEQGKKRALKVAWRAASPAAAVPRAVAPHLVQKPERLRAGTPPAVSATACCCCG